MSAGSRRWSGPAKAAGPIPDRAGPTKAPPWRWIAERRAALPKTPAAAPEASSVPEPAAIHHCRPPQPANCAAGSSGPTGLTRQGVDFRRDVTRYPAKFSLRIDPCDPSPNAASDGGPRSDPHGTFECHPADGPATETADP